MALDKSNTETKKSPRDRGGVVVYDDETYDVSREDQEKVKKLKRLYDDKVVTKEEFKKRIHLIMKKYLDQDLSPEEMLQKQLNDLQVQLDTKEISKEEYKKQREKILDQLVGE